MVVPHSICAQESIPKDICGLYGLRAQSLDHFDSALWHIIAVPIFFMDQYVLVSGVKRTIQAQYSGPIRIHSASVFGITAGVMLRRTALNDFNVPCHHFNTFLSLM